MVLPQALLEQSRDYFSQSGYRWGGDAKGAFVCTKDFRVGPLRWEMLPVCRLRLSNKRKFLFVAALVGSLTIGTTFLLSSVAGVLTDSFGLRAVTFVGGAFASLGILLSSFITQDVGIKILLKTLQVLLFLPRKKRVSTSFKETEYIQKKVRRAYRY